MDFNLGILDTRPGPIPTGIAASPSWTPMRTGPSSIENSLSRQTVAKPRTSKIRMDKPTTTSTPSTDRPTSKSKDIMADITCNDPMKVKRALNALDPAQVLRDLENPYRPRWTEILDDWAEVDMPRLIFERWEVRQLERDDSVYWEYDAKRQRLGVRCLPTAIHEAAPDAFRARAFKEVSQLSSESQDVFKIGSNTEFDGFDFPGLPVYRKKEPDAYIKSKEGEFPLVVLEAGFSERESELIQDAQLWLHGSRAAVSFVLVVIITESKSICDDRRNPERHLNDEEVEERLADGTQIQESNSTESEPSTLDQLQFADELRRLHAQKKLMKPLIGDIEANLSVYRKAREGDDEGKKRTSEEFAKLSIFLRDEAAIYPNADKKAIDLPWKEIMGDQIKTLASEDTNKSFTLESQQFKSEIDEAIRLTVKRRARQRAGAILERRGRIGPGPTFGELKRGITKGNEPYEPSDCSDGDDEGPRVKKRKVNS